MITFSGRSLAATVAVLAVSAMPFAALGQEPKAAAPKAATKTATPPKCNSLKVQAGCEARNDCSWVGETMNDKGKVTKKAYCRAKPSPAKKK